MSNICRWFHIVVPSADWHCVACRIRPRTSAAHWHRNGRSVGSQTESASAWGWCLVSAHFASLHRWRASPISLLRSPQSWFGYRCSKPCLSLGLAVDRSTRRFPVAFWWHRYIHQLISGNRSHWFFHLKLRRFAGVRCCETTRTNGMLLRQWRKTSPNRWFPSARHLYFWFFLMLPF